MKYFSENLSPSSNHKLNKNYQSDGAISRMLFQLIQQQGAPEVDIDTFFWESPRISLFREGI